MLPSRVKRLVSPAADKVCSDAKYGEGELNWHRKPCAYRINERDSSELLLQVLCERNWVPYDERLHGKHGWNLWWITGPRHGIEVLQPWQYVNRIPQAGIITRKDRLLRGLRCMSLSYGSVYDFTPTAFVLPNEYLRFVLEYSRGRDTPRNVWICKPTDQSRGRGITVFRELHELSYSTCAIVQRYLCNSLLISGYKFDLRLYACVLSFRPLTIYVYRDGLVRFATEPFDLRSLQNTFSHITNSSINKFSPAYDEGKGSVGLGCKWTIRQLRHYFANIDVPDWCLWQRIGHIILLTLLCEAPLVSSNNNTFELYGFDIIIDETFTPWLLEVNRHPSLGMDCDVDVVVKKPLLHDLMDLMTIEDSMTTFHLQTPDSKIENSIPPLGSRPTSAKMKSSKGNTASKRRICGARRGPSPSAVTAKVSPASGSWKRWSDPPLSVGGFLKVFPTGNKSWKCPSHTRAVVHYIRQLERLFLKVSRNAKRHCQGRIMEDEDYQKALQDLMGTEDVLFWTPRQ